MARLSSASTESDYVPAMVPFNWEAAPGRPARQSITSEFNKNIADAEREIMEVPSLPLPPGKRPKDGFYLTFSRPAQSPHLYNEAGGINSSPRVRRSFNLKFPGSSKKSLFTSRKPQKIREDTGCVEDTHAGGIFNSVSGHRFGSRIARRVLVELQKRRSCLGQCLSPGRKGSSSHGHHHRGRRLDFVDDLNEKEIQKPYPTPTQSAASGSPLSSSSSHDHGHTHNSSVPGARKQLQVASSRFMASILISLCLASSDESDEAEAVDAGNGITDNCGDEISFSEHLTLPRARLSSPEAIFQAPQKGIVVDRASSTVTSPEERTRAWVDLSTNMSRCMLESLHEDPAIANLCEYCRSRKLLQPRISLGTNDFTNKSGQSYTVADHKGSVADAHSVSSTKASPDREVRLRPTRGSCKSSFSWKPRNQIRAGQDPLAVFVTSNVQEPGESELANETYESVVGEERRGSCSSLARNFSTRRSNCSSSSETPKPLHKFVWSGSNRSSTSIGVARNMVDSVSMPRSSCGDSPYSFITSSSVDTPKVSVVRRSTSSNATPTAEPSLLRRNSLEERSEPNQQPASRPISSLPHTLLQNQAQITAPKDFSIKDNLKVPSSSTVWLEALKSSSLWPNPAPKTSTHAAADGDSDDESGNDSEISSTDSSEYKTPRAFSQTPSLNTPVLCNFNPSPKPATWEVSEKLLKSSSLLKYKQQRQQSHESPRSSFMVDQELTTLPSPYHDSKGAHLAVAPAGSLSETSKSNSGVLSKVAQWESKAGVGSSAKSLPIYLSRRRGITITGKAVSR